MIVSEAFQTFLIEARDHAKVWMGVIRGLDAASALALEAYDGPEAANDG